MSNFAAWLQQLVIRIFDALLQLISDAFIAILEMVLQAILGLMSLLPWPFSSNTLQGVFDMLPPEVWFFIGHFQLPACFGILGSALLFRLGRKAITLFQW